MFKTNVLCKTQFGGAQKIFGGMPRSAPRGYGPELLTIVVNATKLLTEEQSYSQGN